METFSKNKKLNTVLNDIYETLLEMCDTKEESIAQIESYKRDFPRESDCNIAQYGNLIISYYDVRIMYKNAGYKIVEKWSNTKVWETYKRQVGYVVRTKF